MLANIAHDITSIFRMIIIYIFTVPFPYAIIKHCQKILPFCRQSTLATFTRLMMSISYNKAYENMCSHHAVIMRLPSQKSGWFALSKKPSLHSFANPAAQLL